MYTGEMKNGNEVGTDWVLMNGNNKNKLPGNVTKLYSGVEVQLFSLPSALDGDE
jgi:hypothetical protein